MDLMGITKAHCVAIVVSALSLFIVYAFIVVATYRVSRKHNSFILFLSHVSDWLAL